MMTRSALYAFLVICLLGLTALQAMAVSYASPYRGKKTTTKGGIYSTAEAAKEAGAIPMLGFQTTSAMANTSATSSTNLLNADGTVNEGSYLTIGNTKPRKSGPGTPGTGDPEDQQKFPLGDGLLPLMLMAIMFAAIIYAKGKTIKSLKQ